MHIGVQTWGSDGDIRPLIALAAGLRSAGHDVALVVTNTENGDYAPLCRTLGLNYVKAPERINCDIPGLIRRVE